MKRRIERIRWQVADWLSWLACKLRGHRWYVADAWYGVPGNRAAELQQQIYGEVMFLATPFSEHQDAVERIDRNLGELAQMAGENWGHIWPKK